MRTFLKKIDKGRLNGLICLANFLKQLDEAKVFFELASLEGGTAQNAIPSKANAVLVIEPKDEELIKQKIEEYVAMLNTKYAGIEDEIKFTITEVQNVPQVVSKEERNNVIKFITQIIDGVYTMSDDMEGLVESSSNLGIFKLNSEGISFTSSIRSSSAGKQNEIIETQIALANECGYKVDSNLLKLAKKVYLEQNGEEIEVVAVHAGLECGTFKVLKPELDMISIGPDITDAHTINETIYLKSIPKVWRLLEGILFRI